MKHCWINTFDAISSNPESEIYPSFQMVSVVVYQGRGGGGHWCNGNVSIVFQWLECQADPGGMYGDRLFIIFLTAAIQCSSCPYRKTSL